MTSTSTQQIQLSKDGKILLKVPQDYEGELVIPEGVTEIAPGAFADCHHITSFAPLPNSLIDEIYDGKNPRGLVKLIQKALDAQAGNFDDEDIMLEDEMEDYIEGEGGVRFLSYYIFDKLITLHIIVNKDGLYMHRDVKYVDGGFVDRVDVEDIDKIMQSLHVSDTEDVIDALMEFCKSDECLFDLNKFELWLRMFHLSFTNSQIGKHIPYIDEEGNFKSKFVPVENKEY